MRSGRVTQALISYALPNLALSHNAQIRRPYGIKKSCHIVQRNMSMGNQSKRLNINKDQNLEISDCAPKGKTAVVGRLTIILTCFSEFHA